MPGFSDYAEGKILDHAFGLASWTMPTTIYISLHTADPGDTGANEATGGSYIRKLLSCTRSSNQISSSALLRWDGMPAGTFTHWGAWDASSNGNFICGGALGGTKRAFTGTAADDLVFTPSHGRSADDRAMFEAPPAGALPTGLNATTLYWVISSGLTADKFKVSTTQGGAAVDLTADGSGFVVHVNAKTLQAGDSFEIASSQLTFTLE